MTAHGPEAKNILFDHCSVAWSIDENLSVSGPRVKNGTAARVTLRNCLIAEGLDNSTHSKGPHSKGTLVHDFVRDVAIAGCFYAHNFNRHPYIKPNATVFMANNLIYNPGNAAIHFAYTPSEYKTIPDPMLPSFLTALGNVYRMGADTKPKVALFTCSPAAPADAPVGYVYQRDNRVYDRQGALLWNGVSGDAAFLSDPRLTLLDTPKIAPANFTPLPSLVTEGYVLKNAGARPKDRDVVDKRIIDDYLARRGRIPDSQDEVGGYPKSRGTHRPLEIPTSPDAVAKWLESYLAEVEY